MFRILSFNWYLLVIFTNYVRSQGEECTLDGFKGRCVELKRCQYLIQVFKEGKKPQMCYFKGDVPYICCTDCKLVDDINKIAVDPLRGPLFQNGRGKSWDYCLDQLKIHPYRCKNHYTSTLLKHWDERSQCHIVWHMSLYIPSAPGGISAKRGEVQHAALLGYGTEGSRMQWLCGGSLLNDRFILTAGHCISSAAVGSPVTTAALGILKRSDPEELWQKYRIQDIIKHPDYNPPSKYNDIALLKTATRIKFSRYVLPVCLPNHHTDRDFYYAKAVGWGALGHHREDADTLQMVFLTEFNQTECAALYEPTRLTTHGHNTTTQQCWGSRDSIQDTCQGDSGGPLYTTSGCQDEVIGVTSYGRECGIRNQPGVYTRVDHYVPWIESVAWP